MPKQSFWLIKEEPSHYPFRRLVEDGVAQWTGIRNFQARNNLRAMKPGDLALYYHTGDEKQVVGVARVRSTPEPDPTAPGEDWTAVEFESVAPLERPVTLSEMKAAPALDDFALLKQGRLSVVPVAPDHFRTILKLGRTKLPRT
jgi:predicted RNA-binding protein with PUA-like domain